MNWLHHTLRKLTARRLASPLAIWGKLPTHVDYVGVNATLPEAQGWQRWVAQQWRPPAAQPSRPARDGGAGWLHLEPPALRLPDASRVPVAFQVPAPVRSLPPHWWRGAMVTSHDGIGRPHPLIVYQRVSDPWLAKASMAAAEGSGPPQDLLYWLVRVLARWQAHREDLGSLSRSIAALDRLLTPGLPQLFGLAAAPVSADQLSAIVDALGADDEVPDAMGFVARARRGARDAAAPAPGRPAQGFWLLDGQGTRLRGAKAWPELWSAGA